jgi:hypothetical protein
MTTELRVPTQTDLEDAIADTYVHNPDTHVASGKTLLPRHLDQAEYVEGAMGEGKASLVPILGTGLISEQLPTGVTNETQPDPVAFKNTPDEISVPSISSAAMLVELNTSVWTGRKLDKTASANLTSDNHADVGVANVHKKLLGNNPELVAIQKYVSNARNHIHYRITMPWSDTGLRLLPTTAFAKYHEEITGMKVHFEELVDKFLDGYEEAVREVHADAHLGALFDPNDYPTVDTIASKFKFRLNYLPLPDVTGFDDNEDFRLSIGQEGVDEVKSYYADYYSEMTTRAMNDIWQRTFTVVGNMSETLQDRPDGSKNRIYDSLVSNVLDIIELLDVCNVTADIKMSNAKDQLHDSLRGITADALREDSDLRAEVKRDVDAVIATLPSLDL